MAWQDDLLSASFRGVPFEVQGISDRAEKALVVHEYPNRSGACVEDLGRGARVMPIRAVFWGQHYLSGIKKLVKALEEQGKAELVHPVFGSVQAVVRSWEIEHDAEHPDYAAVNFECIESQLDEPFFTASSKRGKAAQASASLTSGLAAALQSTAAALTETLEEAQKLPEMAKAAVLEHLSSVLDVYDAAQAVQRAVLSYIDYPAALISDLAACQRTALGVLNTGASAFRALTALSDYFPRLPLAAGKSSTAYATGAGAYARIWTSGTANGRAEAMRAVSSKGQDYALESPAVGSARTIQGSMASHALTAQTQLFAAAAQAALIAELDSPALSPQEIESLVGNSRSRMQDCADYARAACPQAQAYAVAEGMREAALAIQELGAAALDARPPLIRILAAREENFHLLAFRLYGEYARAAELVRLNPQVRNPNFIAKGQELLVYAR